MSRKKKESKSDFHLKIILFVMTLILAQFLAAHASGWILEEGEWDITKIDGLMDYIATHPFDFVSFSLPVYALVYFLSIGLFIYYCLGVNTPKAEMKGEEHGSNDFMTPEEIIEFTRQRTTDNLPYLEEAYRSDNVPEEPGIEEDGGEDDAS